MTELEKKKIELEILSLARSNRRDRIRFIVDILQGMSIIVGVIVAINEFILKDRESENQRSKATLEYVQKISDQEIIAAKDSLKLFKDLCYAMPVGDRQEDSLFENISIRFDKATTSLSNYYNVVHEGIASGYLDEDICKTFLVYDAGEIIDLLSELQSRHYGLQTKYSVPSYKRFRGLIEFYIDCYDVKDDDLKRVPKYDIDKPSN